MYSSRLKCIIFVTAAFFVGLILMFRFICISNCYYSKDLSFSTEKSLNYCESTKWEQVSNKMDYFSKNNILWDDTDLIETARKLIDNPRPFMQKFSNPLMQTPQAKEVDRILKQKTDGFFIECGALDGERSSNTIWLEVKRHWTGLLIEMDPSYYMQLRGKNRKSKSIRACLSPNQHASILKFKEHPMGEGKIVSEKASGSFVYDTYCFPLLTLMLAMNVSKIDYLSLDVEGMELPILKTIPFDKLDIKVLSVEYLHAKEGKKKYVQFMENHGYKVEKEMGFRRKDVYLSVYDFIFVKK